MAYAYESYLIQPIDLHQTPSAWIGLLDGQRNALQNFGVTGDAIGLDETQIPPGTHAIVARASDGEIIAGLRLQTRTAASSLSIESEDSPLHSEFRKKISAQSDACEIGGLWVSPHAAGRFLSRKLVAYGTRHAYELGCQSVVGLSHARAFRFITAPLGYEMDQEIPAFAYPDERFQSFIVWHRQGPESLSQHLAPQATFPSASALREAGTVAQ